jgi:6-phosphogluconolactonase (cycloisomerase 2 family)
MKYRVLIFAFALTTAAANLVFAQNYKSSHGEAHAVFVMTNSPYRNEIIGYRRLTNGSLREAGRFFTGGRGSGGKVDPLSSQGSLVLSDNGDYLYAANAGSGTVSVFRIRGASLWLEDVQPTFGVEPNSIAQRGDLLYVLNAATASSVVGFHIRGNGRLVPIPHSHAFLSGNEVGPADISISPDSRFLLVTERITNNIDVFAIQQDGTLGPIVINHDATPGTFAFAFSSDGALLVTETGPAGGTNASSVSTFLIDASGKLTPVGVAIPTLGAAACWNIVTPTGKFTYVSNAGTSTISGYSIAPGGSLAPLPGTVVGKNPPNSTNLDLAISNDERFLYTLNGAAGTIGIFAIQSDGGLILRNLVSGLPASSGLNGIAAY